jgi:hypothetical protein
MLTEDLRVMTKTLSCRWLLRRIRSRFGGYCLLESTRRRRQLQHRSALISAQIRKEYDFTIGKFHRVVVDRRFVHVDLPKPGCFCAGFSSKTRKPSVVLDFCLKCDLGSWKETYRNLWFFDRRKTSC